jgi:hypothetical protein
MIVAPVVTPLPPSNVTGTTDSSLSQASVQKVPTTGDMNCVGSWSACDFATGKQAYKITTPASGNGAKCPAKEGDLRSCVNGLVEWVQKYISLNTIVYIILFFIALSYVRSYLPSFGGGGGAKTVVVT